MNYEWNQLGLLLTNCCLHTEVLERLEIGQVGSLSPRHPNNIRANSNSAPYRSPSVRCIYPPSPTMHTTPTKTVMAPVIRMFDVTSKVSEQGQVKIKSEDSGFLLEDVATGLDNCVDPALTDLALQVKSHSGLYANYYQSHMFWWTCRC